MKKAIGVPNAKIANPVIKTAWNHVRPILSDTTDPEATCFTVTRATAHGRRMCRQDSRQRDPLKKPLAFMIALRAASGDKGLLISRVSVHHGFSQSGKCTAPKW